MCKSIHGYLQRHGLSQAEFAARVGVSQSMVSHWLGGRYAVTPERARQIEIVTDGEISRMSLLYPDEETAA